MTEEERQVRRVTRRLLGPIQPTHADIGRKVVLIEPLGGLPVSGTLTSLDRDLPAARVIFREGDWATSVLLPYWRLDWADSGEA